MRTFDVECAGQSFTLTPEVKLYTTRDFMGEYMPGIALQLYVADETSETGYGEPFCLLTVNFGDFIGTKNAAYIDTNNCPFADQILKTGVAKDTGLYKESGFCKYPLWVFDEDFLKEHGSENYSFYSEKYDQYMKDNFEDPNIENETGNNEEDHPAMEI